MSHALSARVLCELVAVTFRGAGPEDASPEPMPWNPFPMLDDATLTALASVALVLGVLAFGYGLAGYIALRRRPPSPRAAVSLRTVTVTRDDDDHVLCRHCNAYQRYGSTDPTCWLCNRRLDGTVDATETPAAPPEAS